MAVRSVILFIGVYFGFGKAADSEYAKLGGTITLVPTFTGQMDEILWRHGDNLDKVVEFDGRQNKEFKSFVGRTVLDFVTGELTINALTAEDSGLYRLEAHINNHLQYSNHEVQVIAEVAQPTIICKVNDTKTASMAILQCNADRQDQQSPITYNWERLEDTLHGSVSSDQKLSIAVKDTHDEAVFQCSVSNLVSKKQAQFQVKNCFTEESSSTALAVGLSMLFLIILLIVLGLLLHYMRHRTAKPNSNKQDDVEVPLVQTSKSAEQSQVQPEPDYSKAERDVAVGEQPKPGKVKHLVSFFSPQKSAVAAGELVTKEPTDQAVPEPDCKIVKAEQKKDSISQTLNSKEDPITANTPAVSKSVERSQVQPEPDDSKAERDVDPCQQTNPSSSSSTSPGELVGSDGSKEAEEGMEAGDVAEKKTEGGGDTSLGMDGSMETEDAENKKSAEDVGNMEQPSMTEEKVDTDKSAEKNPDKGEKANVSSPVVAVGLDVKNANIELDLKKDKGGIKVDSQMEEAGSDEQGETGHQKQPDTDKMGQTGLLEHRSNPTQLVLEPEAIKNMLETKTELKCEAPAEGHQVENSESFSTFPGGEEGDEDGLNDTEKGMEPRDGKTEQKTNDGEIVEDIMYQNGEEAIVKAELEKDPETLNSKEHQITANTPAAVAVSKSAELSQVQPEPDDSKAERDVAVGEQPKPGKVEHLVSFFSPQKSAVAAGELVTKEPTDQAVPEPDCKIVKAEQKKDSISQTLNSKEDPITANTPAVSKPAELSQVQPEPNDSKAERDVDPCQQTKPRSSSSTSPGELVGSDGSKEAEEGLKAGDVGEKKTEGGADTSLEMDGIMEDGEN